MATTIVTKNGSGAPTASDLVAGELAVDLTNGRLYTEDSGGSVIEIGLNPSGNVDITGTATMDGLTVDGQGKIQGSFALLDLVETDITDKNTRVITSGGQFRVDTVNDALSSSTKRIMVDHTTGDISFYEDTGTTAKFFWDASAESLGIGTSSPRSVLDLDGGSETQLRLQTTNTGSTTGDGLLVSLDASTNAQAYVWNYENAAMIFGTNATEAMRIDASGNVDLYQGNNLTWRYAAGSTIRGSISVDSADNITFSNTSSNTERMRLDSSGNLLVGKTSTTFSVVGVENRADGRITSTRSGNTNLLLNRLSSDGDIVQFYKDGTQVGSIGTANSGDLYIGNDDTTLLFAGGSDAIIPRGTAGASRDAAIDLGSSNHRFKNFYLSGKVITGGNTTSNVGTISFVADSERCVITGGYDTGGGGILKFFTDSAGGTSLQRMSINNAGTVTIVGALSKGSGSFKIDHPLPEKTDTHHLVHSFVESPQADNIYRGKVDLVDGSATVNIDDAAGMTEGTYVLLNTNTQCFTSNESGWTAVKGSVSGNILTITAQESCSDTISWLVIGERHDQHMLDTDWTDENGKVIVEPLKELQETE